MEHWTAAVSNCHDGYDVTSVQVKEDQRRKQSPDDQRESSGRRQCMLSILTQHAYHVIMPMPAEPTRSNAIDTRKIQTETEREREREREAERGIERDAESQREKRERERERQRERERGTQGAQ